MNDKRLLFFLHSSIVYRTSVNAYVINARYGTQPVHFLNVLVSCWYPQASAWKRLNNLLMQLRKVFIRVYAHIHINISIHKYICRIHALRCELSPSPKLTFAQVCNHPYLMPGAYPEQASEDIVLASGKMVRVVYILGCSA